MQKRTKIVATIADNRCTKEFLSKLYEAGVNVVRFNTAHTTPEKTREAIKIIRSVSPNLAVLIDTKGPEIRTSGLGSEIHLKKDDTIKVAGGNNCKSSDDTLYVSYLNIVEEIADNSTILIDDGDIALQVIEKTATHLVCKTLNEGTIKLRKSVNVPNMPISLPSLTTRDKDYVKLAIEEEIDFIAHSFVRTKDDVLQIKQILDAHNSKIKVIAKIENQQGVNNIDEILDVAYGVMVARGDLAIETPAERVPIVQKEIVQKCIESKKPVIIATQMLHSMIEHPRPTRAEITDVANAIFQQADAIMLSGETAYGAYPIEAVQVMSKVAHEIECSMKTNHTQHFVRVNNEITAALARSAVYSCATLPVKAIIIDTLSGRTGRYLAAFRGQIPIYAICYDKQIMRQLALSYGVEATYKEPQSSRDRFLIDAMGLMTENHKIQPDDLVIVIGGSFGPANGATFMEICKVRDIVE